MLCFPKRGHHKIQASKVFVTKNILIRELTASVQWMKMFASAVGYSESTADISPVVESLVVCNVMNIFFVFMCLV